MAKSNLPVKTPRKPKRAASIDRIEAPMRCQQIALGTYNVLRPRTHARQQISTSSYPSDSRSSKPPNSSKNLLRTIIQAAEAMNTDDF